ncbi:hypothetical protein D3C72_705880 [compost metagenome]
MFAPGSDLETIGQGVMRHDERMVAGDPQRILESLEYPLPRMADEGRLAVHHLTGTHHPGAERLSQGLVAEADAENGYLTGKTGDGRQRDARLVRRAGTGRDHQMAWGKPGYLFQTQLVVAPDHHVLPQGAKILHQVPGKGVVVVDE